MKFSEKFLALGESERQLCRAGRQSVLGIKVPDLEFLNALLKLVLYVISEKLRMNLQIQRDGSAGKVKGTCTQA